MRHDAEREGGVQATHIGREGGEVLHEAVEVGNECAGTGTLPCVHNNNSGGNETVIEMGDR